MANKALNVSAGKPKATGAIWTAPLGTPLPTDTDSELTGFDCLGYCSDDGLTNSTNLESETIKAWGGDTVLTIQKSKEDKYKFKLIEVLNVDVLKFVYGSANVSGDLETGIVLQANNTDVEEKTIVIDMIMRDNTAKRVVIPTCKISEIADIVYSDSAAVGYETTVACTPDNAGNTHYEYIRKSVISA